LVPHQRIEQNAAGQHDAEGALCRHLVRQPTDKLAIAQISRVEFVESKTFPFWN
jgi:hypothetical protein